MTIIYIYTYTRRIGDDVNMCTYSNVFNDLHLAWKHDHNTRIQFRGPYRCCKDSDKGRNRHRALHCYPLSLYLRVYATINWNRHWQLMMDICTEAAYQAHLLVQLHHHASQSFGILQGSLFRTQDIFISNTRGKEKPN